MRAADPRIADPRAGWPEAAGLAMLCPVMSELRAFVEGLACRDGALLLPVRAHPGARREGLRDLHGGALRVATSAPAADGRATQRIGRLLAGALGLRPSRVRCVRGANSRSKLYAVQDADRPTLLARLRESLT